MIKAFEQRSARAHAGGANRESATSPPLGTTTINSVRVQMLRERGAGASRKLSVPPLGPGERPPPGGSDGDEAMLPSPVEAGAPVQRLPGAAAPTRDPGRIHAAARAGLAGAGQALPHLPVIQQSFGKHDVSGVTAHMGREATAGALSMDAAAYALGEHVAFARKPSLHEAAHEAAHVVQQRAGLHFPGGVGQVGDPHERHADAVAHAVSSGQSAEGLLDRYTGRCSAAGVPVTAVQRKLVGRDGRDIWNDPLYPVKRRVANEPNPKVRTAVYRLHYLISDEIRVDGYDQLVGWINRGRFDSQLKQSRKVVNDRELELREALRKVFQMPLGPKLEGLEAQCKRLAGLEMESRGTDVHDIINKAKISADQAYASKMHRALQELPKMPFRHAQSRIADLEMESRGTHVHHMMEELKRSVDQGYAEVRPRQLERWREIANVSHGDKSRKKAAKISKGVGFLVGVPEAAAHVPRLLADVSEGAAHAALLGAANGANVPLDWMGVGGAPIALVKNLANAARTGDALLHDETKKKDKFVSTFKLVSLLSTGTKNAALTVHLGAKLHDAYDGLAASGLAPSGLVASTGSVIPWASIVTGSADVIRGGVGGILAQNRMTRLNETATNAKTAEDKETQALATFARDAQETKRTHNALTFLKGAAAVAGGAVLVALGLTNPIGLGILFGASVIGGITTGYKYWKRYQRGKAVGDARTPIGQLLRAAGIDVPTDTDIALVDKGWKGSKRIKWLMQEHTRLKMVMAQVAQKLYRECVKAPVPRTGTEERRRYDAMLEILDAIGLGAIEEDKEAKLLPGEKPKLKLNPKAKDNLTPEVIARALKA